MICVQCGEKMTYTLGERDSDDGVLIRDMHVMKCRCGVEVKITTTYEWSGDEQDNGAS